MPQIASKTPIRGRFAPSPSGRMHLGNLFAALLAWLDVRKLGGEMLLRMEDLDPDRCKPIYTTQLADDLRWLGLDWDLGWEKSPGVFCQSGRTAQYAEAFHTLEGKGLLYPCYCSRKELLSASAPHGEDGSRLYSGRCRTLSLHERQRLEAAGRKPAVRVRVPEECVTFRDDNFGPQTSVLARDCGDFILRRSDGVYAYQLAVTADDGAMGVTRVVRGWDLLSSTARQLWLFEQLGYETAPTYCHAPLLCSADGRRLSKRDRDLDVGYLRAHATPEAVVGVLAYTAGLLERYEPVQPRELVRDFSWAKVGRDNRPVKGLEVLGL